MKTSSNNTPPPEGGDLETEGPSGSAPGAGGTKKRKPWSRPRVRVVMFNSNVEGTPRYPSPSVYTENPATPPATGKYDPNIS